MSVITNNKTLVASAADTATLTLPKSDIADLRGSSPSSVPLNDEALLQDCSGGLDLVRLLLEEFQANGPDRVEQISRRIESGDQNAVARTARELKSSADAISATTLRNLAGALEQSTGMVSRGCPERLVARLRREMNRCLDHIPLVVASARSDSWASV